MSSGDVPPTPGETFTKVVIKLADAVPFVGHGISEALQVVYDDVRARRAAAATITMTEIVEGSGGVDKLSKALGGNAQLESVFVAAVEAAIRTSHEQKRRLLVHAVTEAVKDDAKVDESQLMVETLAQLDVPHIHALERLASERLSPVDPETTHWGQSAVWDAELDPIKAALVRVGAARPSPSTRVARTGGIPSEGITSYGLRILDELRSMERN